LGWIAALLLGLRPVAPGAIYSTSFPVQGTAVNATSVIAVGEGRATAVNLSSGAQTALSQPSLTIDAGQYNDTFTMYLAKSGGGVLQIINNYNGDPLPGGGTFGGLGSDIFGVSGAVAIGGTWYAFVAGTSSGVRALNLSNGQFTSIPGSYDFTDATGFDAFMRPGGSSLADVAFGIQRNWPQLDIYGNGSWVGSHTPNSSLGTVNDLSFDWAKNQIWFGSELSQSSGKLFNEPFSFAPYAVTNAWVAVSGSNSWVRVEWLGRVLEAGSTLTNWSAVATAPGSPTQLFAPPPYLDAATNTARFYRARW
jgi:hypothetical protein